MDEEFAKAQEQDGTTLTQWTNAAYRIGRTDGFGEGTLIGFAIGAGACVIGAGIGLLATFAGPKIREFKTKRLQKKAKG